MTDEPAELTLQAVALLHGAAFAMLRRASAAAPANSPHHAGRVARRTAEAVYSTIGKPADCAYAAGLAARARRPGSPTWWAATTHFGA